MGGRKCRTGFPGCKLYLQPEWSKSAQVTPLIIEYIKTNPQWQLSLQVHKYINIHKRT
jgi:organic radical activating enzyme